MSINLTSSSSDFEFIKDDVQEQRKIANHILKQAEEIQALLDQDPDRSDNTKLEILRDAILKSAKELASNASSTSNTASTVIAKVTAKST